MAATHFERSVSPDAYANALAHAYFAGYRIYDPSLAGSRDPESEHKMMRFPAFVAPLQVRHTAIAGKAWTISPADEARDEDTALALIVSKLVGNIDGFVQARINLARADVSGARFAEIVWKTIVAKYGDGSPRKWTIPVALRDMPKENFRWFPTTQGDRPRARLEFARKSSGTVNWVPVPGWTPLIRHFIGDSEETLGYGRGLREPLWFLYVALTRLFESDVQAAERMGHGWLVLTLDHEAAGDPTVANTALVTTAQANLDKSRARHTFVIGKGDSLQFLAPPSSAADFMGKLSERLERMADRLIMGASLFAGGGSSEQGSRARAETEADTAAGVFDVLGEQLEETLTRDLIGCVMRANHANIVSLGLGNADGPRFSMESGREMDPKAAAERLEIVLRSGLKVKADEAYELVGFTKPGPDDDVVSGPSPAPLPGGMPFGADSRIVFAEWDEAKHKRNAGKFATTEGARARGKEPSSKRSSPGSQLSPDVLSRMREVGDGKLPPQEATDIKVYEPSDTGPLATWRDAKGRMQYAYSREFHRRNAERKWNRVMSLEPKYDEIVEGMHARMVGLEHGSPDHQASVVATLMAMTGMRPGNAASAQSGHYGASTLLGSHVTIADGKASFDFVGKEGVQNLWSTDDADLVQALSKYKRAGGDGPLFSIDAQKAREFAPSGMKLKDFRTIQATRAARSAMESVDAPPPPLTGDAKKDKRLVRDAILGASRRVALLLNNTPAVARGSYIHPSVFNEWLDKIGGKHLATA